MADAVATVTDAPKKALAFAQSQLFAFLFLAVLLMILFVYVETHKTSATGGVIAKVYKLPGIGPWATNMPKQG